MRYIFYIILSIALFTNLVFTQNEKDKPDSDKEAFYLDALNFYSPDSTRTRLDVYVEIPYKNLEFKKIKGQSNYSSEFDLTIDIKDPLNNTAFNKVYKEKITTQKTEVEYMSMSSSIIIKNIFLPPGQYKLKVSIYEPGTLHIYEKNKDITIRDFLASPLAISDIMMVSKISDEKDRKRITPLVSRNVSDLDSFYLFFFVYKNTEDSDIEVSFKITDSKNNSIFYATNMINANSGIDVTNQMLMPIMLKDLSFDKYNIEITAKSTSGTATTLSSFDSRAGDFPISLDNIDELISQLQYIAKDEELDHMKKGKTDAEKKKRFIEFWKSKDPSPNTKRNEVMIEYYKRIRYADKNYSTVYNKGWKSDMGMVYIIFGEPNNIEKHPYEMDSKPYEIWDYYDYNKQFVFVDYTGFGDYRLITPIWDTFKFNR